MSTTLEPADLTGAMVGTTGSIDLTQVTGPGGISYAIGGQATLRLHNESNCGLRCFFDNSGQSFNLPAGGWSDCYPKSSDNALNFTVLYTLSSPGVTLLLATYYFAGEPVPAQTTLGNSPIGGGNVSTNFSELVNTGNNPLSTLINVQPNDATAPTWTADNSGNLAISGDNAGVLTQLFKLVAGASPSAQLISTGINIAPSPSSVALFVLSTGKGQDGVVVRATADTTDIMLGVENSSHAVTWSVDSLGNETVSGNIVASGSISTIGLALKSTQLPGTPFTVTTNATIATSDASKTVTNSGAVTGIILATPSLGDGGVFALFNNGSGSITFAASGSGVAGGSAVVVGAGNSALFVHSIVDGLWHRIVAN